MMIKVDEEGEEFRKKGMKNNCAKKYRIGAIIGAPYMSTSTATELSAFSCASFSADSIFPRLTERVPRNQEDREKVEEFG
jgi:hypothetical protein